MKPGLAAAEGDGAAGDNDVMPAFSPIAPDVPSGVRGLFRGEGLQASAVLIVTFNSGAGLSGLVTVIWSGHNPPIHLQPDPFGVLLDPNPPGFHDGFASLTCRLSAEDPEEAYHILSKHLPPGHSLDAFKAHQIVMPDCAAASPLVCMALPFQLPMSLPAFVPARPDLFLMGAGVRCHTGAAAGNIIK